MKLKSHEKKINRYLLINDILKKNENTLQKMDRKLQQQFFGSNKRFFTPITKHEIGTYCFSDNVFSL